jgi:hypothetical protein
MSRFTITAAKFVGSVSLGLLTVCVIAMHLDKNGSNSTAEGILTIIDSNGFNLNRAFHIHSRTLLSHRSFAFLQRQPLNPHSTIYSPAVAFTYERSPFSRLHLSFLLMSSLRAGAVTLTSSGQQRRLD